MRHTRHILFLLISVSFFLISAIDVFAQQDVKTIIPLSPNAAEFTKYGETPVNYFTGVPNIKIPLTLVKSKQLVLPLELSYHAGGNKVESTASWVGLGWALSNIPVITRSVNAIPDEGADGYFYRYNGRSIKQLIEDPQYGQTNGIENFLRRVKAGNADTEPDDFFYTLNGGSGKFYYNQETNSFATANKAEVKVDWNGNTFVITNDNGDKYYFTEKEYTQDKTNDNAPPVATAWYVSKIVNEGRTDSISFSYIDQRQQLKQFTSHTIYQSVGGSLGDCVLESGIYPGGPNSGSDSRLITSWVESKVISQINFNGGSIIFNQGESRLDLNGGKTLDNIQILAGANLIKSYKFNYFYKIASTTQGALINESYNSYWLFLKEIQEFNALGTEHFDHKIEYLETLVPHRGSVAQDYWGYFNGRIYNQNLIPTVHINQQGNLVQIEGADRNVDTTASKFGLISKIIYPTGGFTKFKFENHEAVSDQVPQNYKHIEQILHGEKIDEEFEITNPTHTVYSRTFTINNPPHQFLNNFDPRGGTFIKVNFSDLGCDFNAGDTECANISLKRTDNNQFIYNNLGYPTQSLYIPNGTYEMRIEFNPNFNPVPDYGYFHYQIDYMAIDTSINTNFVGGIRIKEIQQYDNSDTQPSTRKFYRYTRGLDSNESSGEVFGADGLIYSDQYTYLSRCKIIFNDSWKFDTKNYLRIKAYSNIQQVTHSGSYVGYATIIIQNNINGNEGVSVYNYDNEYDLTDSAFPYPPPVSKEAFRGNVIKECHYKKIGDDLILTSKVDNTYFKASLNSTTVYAMKTGVNVASNYPEEAGLPSKVNYQLNTLVCRLMARSETLYSGNDTTNKVRKVTSYTYDPEHFYLKTTSTVNSANDIIVNSIKYPFDLMADPVYQAMVNRNILTSQIESEITKNYVFQEKVTNKYQFWHDKFFELKSVEKVVSNSGPVKQLTFDRYGFDKRIESYATLNAPLVSYKWGYDRQYPVAEVTNASADEFYFENFEEVSAGILGESHSGLKYSTNPNVNWTRPNGRDYMISYWFKVGTTWRYSGEIPYTGGSFTMSGGTAFDDIRIVPKDAQMTTYTYSPLVGMTSMTDARGETTYYEYDSFKRLRNVKDSKGHIIRQTDYHYKN